MVPRGWRWLWTSFVVAVIATVMGVLVVQNTELTSRVNELVGSLDDPWSVLKDTGLWNDKLLSKEMRENMEQMFNKARKWYETHDFEVGRRLKREGAEPHHPVVLIPGIVSSGLESWDTSEEESPLFRQRLWGSTSMFRSALFDKEKWVRHLMLDPVTGVDPEGIRVRAAQGLDAASYFAAGYWVWSKIVENLAAVGYDINQIYLASYDWRLSTRNLEERDHFFSRIMSQIEFNSRVYKRKTVLISHSMGGTVAMYLLKWLEHERGAAWIDEHIEALANLSGTLLGVPKAMPALMTGEMRDTVQVPSMLAYLLERFFSAQERAALFRTWAGSSSMIVKGGNAVWGDVHGAPDDTPNATKTHGILMEYANRPDLNETEPTRKLRADDVYPWLNKHTDQHYQNMLKTNYSFGIERDSAQIRANNKDPTKWTNPLEVALPHAPHMKVYCIYGWNKPTERSYWMYEQETESALNERSPDGFEYSESLRNRTSDTDKLMVSRIDGQMNDEESVPPLDSGVRMGEGDGTVSLLSLGSMCAHGWHMDRYNPARLKVVTHEVYHNPEAFDLRGGTSSGDHIDILGSKDLNEAIVRIATGRGDQVQERIYSPIATYAKRIQW